MRDYKGYRLYIATRHHGAVAFITRNDGDRVWGIGFVPDDETLGRQTHDRIEEWERSGDAEEAWGRAYLFSRSSYTVIREVEIDPSQREDRYVVEVSPGFESGAYIVRDTETSEYTLWWLEDNAEHAAKRLNEGSLGHDEYRWRPLPAEEVKPDRIRTGTATYVDSLRYFVEVDGDDREYYAAEAKRDAAVEWLRGDQERTLRHARSEFGYGMGRDTAGGRMSFYDDVKYDDNTPEEETVPAEIDYKAAYETAMEALRKEADKRGWCADFDMFVTENNLPETLTETKVRVTLELTIPKRNPTTINVENELEKFIANPHTALVWEKI